MSLGKNREEQELTRKLAATLVQKEVIEPMNKIGWVHGTPPPPDYSGQPATISSAARAWDDPSSATMTAPIRSSRATSTGQVA